MNMKLNYQQQVLFVVIVRIGMDLWQKEFVGRFNKYILIIYT